MPEANTLEKIEIKPQPGPQTTFMATPADIAVFGGSAGGGKTWALLLEPLRNIANPNFGAVIFRRTSTQVKNEGGLWDESRRLYPGAGGIPREYDLYWKFPSGASISFAHLEHDKNVFDWQGSQVPLIGFDELCHFTSAQFWYMLSRNRSTCGVRPYVRCTCNPDSDSWVAEFLSWWIDPDTGYAIPERSGRLRWFVRIGEEIVWADEPSELKSYTNPLTGDPIPPKSVTFVPSKLSDNKVLARDDPGYIANLMALPTVERERLLNGNWKIRWQNQTFFDTSTLLENGRPINNPLKCDGIFAVLDTASKTGFQHDGTAVIWCARTKGYGYPLIILDWEILQIDSNLLEYWLPSVFIQGEELARRCGARMGFLGAWIEDKSSGTILLQQALKKHLHVRGINSKLTSMGKDERALSVSAYVRLGKIKITKYAYDKVMTYKKVTKNHFLDQVENFSIGDKDTKSRADDLLDCFTYCAALALGNAAGF